MKAKQKILEIIEKDTLSYKGMSNLFSFLSKTYSLSLEEIKKDFDKLLYDGKIFEDKKGHFIAIPSHGYVKGKYIGNAKGFGFCEIGNDQEDIFIPGNLSGGAIDGDVVIVTGIELIRIFE